MSIPIPANSALTCSRTRSRKHSAVLRVAELEAKSPRTTFEQITITMLHPFVANLLWQNFPFFFPQKETKIKKFAPRQSGISVTRGRHNLRHHISSSQRHIKTTEISKHVSLWTKKTKRSVVAEVVRCLLW